MAGLVPAQKEFVMTIGRRITSACSVLVALSAAIGGVAVLSIDRISRQMATVVDDTLPGTYALGRIDSLQLDLRGSTLHHVATPDPKVKAVKDSQSADLAGQAPAILQQYAGHRERRPESPALSAYFRSAGCFTSEPVKKYAR